MRNFAQALVNPGQEKRFQQYGCTLWCRDRADVERMEGLINLRGDLEKVDPYIADLKLSREDERVLASWCVTLNKAMDLAVARRAAKELAERVDLVAFIDSLGDAFPGKNLLWEVYREFNDISAVYMLGYMDGAKHQEAD